MDTERVRAILQRGQEVTDRLQAIAARCDAAGLPWEAFDLRRTATMITDTTGTYGQAAQLAGLLP